MDEPLIKQALTADLVAIAIIAAARAYRDDPVHAMLVAPKARGAHRRCLVAAATALWDCGYKTQNGAGQLLKLLDSCVSQAVGRDKPEFSSAWHAARDAIRGFEAKMQPAPEPEPEPAPQPALKTVPVSSEDAEPTRYIPTKGRMAASMGLQPLSFRSEEPVRTTRWDGPLPVSCKVVACMPLPRGQFSLDLKLPNDRRVSVRHGSLLTPGQAMVSADLVDGVWIIVSEAA